MFKGRKLLSSTLIENPIDALLHILLCQNWSEIIGLTKNWGKEECSIGDVLINIGNDVGSFNHPNLDEIKNLKIARQILEESEAWTDVLIQSLCEDFFLLNYQEQGYECIIDILQLTRPTETITLNDCNKIGNIQENNEVYVEPIIKYGYDQLSNKYKKEIRITNTWKDTYDASYVNGITNSNVAQVFWNYFHEMFTKCKKINEVPSNIQEKKWFTDESTALWYLKRLYKIMNMNKISIEVNYEKGRLYHLGQHVYLSLPHQTRNIPVECVIENFSKDKNGNSVELDLLMLEDFSDVSIIETGIETNTIVEIGDAQNIINENNL